MCCRGVYLSSSSVIAHHVSKSDSPSSLLLLFHLPISMPSKSVRNAANSDADGLWPLSCTYWYHLSCRGLRSQAKCLIDQHPSFPHTKHFLSRLLLVSDPRYPPLPCKP